MSSLLGQPTRIEENGEKKEGNVLFNDTLNTFYLWLYGVGHMVKDPEIVREETRCCHMGYSFRLAARVLLYAPSHRQDSTYHGLCYTSRGALAGTRNSSMGPPHEGSILRSIAPWADALTEENESGFLDVLITRRKWKSSIFHYRYRLLQILDQSQTGKFHFLSVIVVNGFTSTALRIKY